jgi:hypothetical protein
MQIELPSGTTWHIHAVAKKLAYRAGLPGARLFDLAAESLRAAKRSGVSVSDRFTLALPSSWLVNSPAISRVLRRWALPPHRETCLALVELLEAGPEEWAHDPGWAAAIDLALRSLGDEPYVTEALSKVLALIVPDAVPLMPAAARGFVLGPEDGQNAEGAFARIVAWFGQTTAAHGAELDQLARAHRNERGEAELVGSGVLDRLLWFDSEGHVHFPPVA